MSDNKPEWQKDNQQQLRPQAPEKSHGITVASFPCIVKHPRSGKKRDQKIY
jgi:hypothetical protein